MSSVEIAPVGRDGNVGARSRLACDLVLMSGGFTPSVHLFSQVARQAAFRAEAATPSFPTARLKRERSVGACRGVFGLAAAIADGVAAGEAAARRRGGRRRRAPVHPPSGSEDLGGGRLEPLPHHRDARRAKAFVDFQNDVTAKDIALAVREGFRSIEHVKRYTTTGMATDQGKTSNMNALGVAAGGPATSRCPTSASPPSACPIRRSPSAPSPAPSRGELFDPVRVTPIHDWASAQRARCSRTSGYGSARAISRAPARTCMQAVARECQAVRQAVGIFDASTLGKIEVVGPDAAEFLNRIYINAWSKLEPGRCRYGLMLREDGFVLDDGVVGRLAADRFHVTTTTGGARARACHDGGLSCRPNGRTSMSGSPRRPNNGR